MSAISNTDSCEDGIPYPIVAVNRGIIVGGVLLALWTNQPLLTTVVLALLAPAALFGRKASPIFRIGSVLLREAIAHAPVEDQRVQRFNNIIAVVMLGAAQLAFILGAAWLGWVFSVAVAFAALVALCGFCVGCFLYFQFRINRSRLVRAGARGK
jgi:hypothetical protein